MKLTFLQEQSGDNALPLYLYWLTNVHELLSLVCITEPVKTSAHQQSVDQLANKVKVKLQELQILVFTFINTNIHSKLNKMVVPAVIESQSLPGFLASDRIYSQAAYTMDDLIRYLNQVMTLLDRYKLETSTQEQVVTEMLNTIGTVCFNDLVGRRNYNSWKRGKFRGDI